MALKHCVQGKTKITARMHVFISFVFVQITFGFLGQFSMLFSTVERQSAVTGYLKARSSFWVDS